MAKRPYRQIFLETLAKLGGSEGGTVSDGTLRGELGWQPDRYDKIKNDLRKSGEIQVRKGPGGPMTLNGTSQPKPAKVFISYCHVDELLKDQIRKHLEPLRRSSLISDWHDREIKAGDQWDRHISANLNEAEIILLLISIDFVNSKYCYDKEMIRAMERHDSGEARVIPIILRHCLWGETPFSKLQALPKDGKAISSWPDQDEALMTVAAAIGEIAKGRMKT